MPLSIINAPTMSSASNTSAMLTTIRSPLSILPSPTSRLPCRLPSPVRLEIREAPAHVNDVLGHQRVGALAVPAPDRLEHAPVALEDVAEDFDGRVQV